MGLGPRIVPRGITYISSSGVIARTLDDLGWMGNRETPLVLATWSEDLAMAAFLPVGTVLLVGGGAWRVSISVIVATLVVVVS